MIENKVEGVVGFRGFVKSVKGESIEFNWALYWFCVAINVRIACYLTCPITCAYLSGPYLPCVIIWCASAVVGSLIGCAITQFVSFD